MSLHAIISTGLQVRIFAFLLLMPLA